MEQGSISPGIYSAYQDVVNEEGTTKIFSKLTIDAIAMLILIISKKIIIKFENTNFDLLLIICILLFIACLVYSPFPVMSLRLEYYLNFLIILALGSLVASEKIKKSVVKIIMFFSIASMYAYSFLVYEHPSITRYFVF